MKKTTVLLNRVNFRYGWTLVMLLALPLFFASCSKDKDGNGEPDVKPSAVSGSWKISGMKVNPGMDMGNGQVVTDLLDFLSEYGDADAIACLTDTKITFNNNGTITGTPSPNCKSDDMDDLNPAENNAKWSVNGNKLTITDSDGAQTYDLETSGNTMKWSVLQEDDMDGDGKADKYTMTIEFKKA
ncbi:lipocalin family protein [Larkinella insperata]|uniref:Lipocalin family protein n=1 Tax=Larkinella insperata TaxID=332158 RepID=A0ABW3Q4H9_9BACT|nr:lipocalin family protein [Larkinella insperata]